ncbi:centromere binding protein B [Aspergillus costaricaensis CBS 115574]|uniref:Centromere binding protein B n=1 Tax=Aspergillus costaricaensis CBS 115574 TaxID=1448317 RepID=A0ACD1ICJ0_9EURO|nr:centromere binding protein B [Aspergillus costaricaensis CBS 115574]RAK87951.1 centromere binding protein B [Aspergillus costaricaensis CBS 115574]
MDTESSHAQEHDFAQTSWLDIGGFSPSEQSPTLDYQAFGYGVVPLDPSYSVDIPPPYEGLPIAMPPPPSSWPSMLSNQGPFPEPGMSAVPLMQAPPTLAPVPTIPAVPRKASISKASTGKSTTGKSSSGKSSSGKSNSNPTPRRTLTDEDRRRMCLYHEENKTAKQTDIGALFGVERSTVSKVLRQKDKYLNPDDGSRSPIKRAKGRVPDIEKALSNWARNYQKQGYPLNDEMIREKALFFASTCGSSDGKEKVLSTSWLEKFKRKYNLMGARNRKGSWASTKSESDSPTCLSIDSALASAVQSPTLLSPTSPTGFLSPLPLSPVQSNENIRGELVQSLAEIASDYQHTHTKSTTSLDTTCSFSAGVTSPTSTFVTESPFTPTSQSLGSSADGNPTRPRSQTFPLSSSDPNLLCPDENSEHLTKAALRQSLSISEHQPPLEEHHDQKFLPALDTSANTIKRNRSNPEFKAKSIYPPLFSKSNTVSPVSSPGSPTQDEARRALELVMNYFKQQPSGLGADDYMTIGKLMERLELAKAQQVTLPGGLTRIDEHDDSPQLNRKRSIHSLG